MEFFIENKKTLIICVSLILLGLVVAYFLKNASYYDDSIEIKEYLKNYKVNEIIPINMDDEQIARKYLTEYLKLIYLNPEKAYDLVLPEYREKRFGNISKFKEYFDNLISDQFFNANIKELQVSRKNKYKQFYIRDINGNTFIFNEYAIKDYKVLFDLITI